MDLDTIIIVTNSSEQARNSTLAYLNHSHFVTQSIEINYNLKKLLPPTYMFDSFPLSIIGTFNDVPTELKVYAVSAGYNGTWPRDLLEIIKATGFKIDEDIILTNKWVRNGRISISMLANGEIYNNLKPNI